MPAKPAAVPAVAPKRELPLAPHLSGPLEAPWLLAYDATLLKLASQLGRKLASFAKPQA